MKRTLLTLAIAALACSCNGSFSAGYLIEGEWDNYSEPTYYEPIDDAVACVTVTGENTYVVDESGSVI